jgi:hypothetical protein
MGMYDTGIDAFLRFQTFFGGMVASSGGQGVPMPFFFHDFELFRIMHQDAKPLFLQIKNTCGEICPEAYTFVPLAFIFNELKVGITTLSA